MATTRKPQTRSQITTRVHAAPPHPDLASHPCGEARQGAPPAPKKHYRKEFGTRGSAALPKGVAALHPAHSAVRRRAPAGRPAGGQSCRGLEFAGRSCPCSTPD